MTDLEIKKITDLTPDSQNANAGTERGLSMLEKSVRARGAGRSILIDKQGRIIAGNKTHQTAIDIGLEDVIIVRTKGDKLVAVMREDLDLADDKTGAREMAYADNRVGEVDLAWSAEQVLADMQAGVDLSAFWSEGELSDLLAGLVEPETSGDTEPQIDRAAELAEEWGTEVGQVWQLGEHRLAVGDCTDKAVVEAVIRGDVVDLGVTSPPYAVGKEYEKHLGFSEHLDLLRGMADRALEVIKSGGFLFVNFGEIAAQSHAKLLTGSLRQCIYPISKDYWQIFHEERGMDLYAQRVWYKPFNLLQQPFWSYHTSIPHYQEWEHIWTWRLPGGNKDFAFDWDISVRAVWSTKDEPTNDRPLTRHVAAFPIGLPERAMKAHSKRHDIIWDPFSGSGTTIIAAHNLNRVARAIELDPGYAAVTLQRFKDHTGIEPELLDGFDT